MPRPDDRAALTELAARRAEDDALLAELDAPPSEEEARESYEFWNKRLSQIPLRRRRARREAEEMVVRWKSRLDAAERARNGPRILEQLLDTLGLHWRPNPRRLIIGFGVLIALLVLLVVALVVAAIVFWPQIEPAARLLLGSGGARESR